MTPTLAVRLARLAYQSAGGLAAGLPPQAQNPMFLSNKGTQGFIADLPHDEAVIAFRGTDPDSIQDWLADLDVDLIPHLDSGGKTHQGFSRALQYVWADLHAEIMRREPLAIHLVGHSLGGALATLCAGRLASLHHSNLAVVTFGCPRVGTIRFANWLQQRLDLNIRYVNGIDPVPRVPHFGFQWQLWPPRLRWCGFYKHVGPMAFCDSNERWYHNPPRLYVEADRIRQYWRDLKQRRATLLEHHYIESYVEAIDLDRMLSRLKGDTA